MLMGLQRAAEYPPHPRDSNGSFDPFDFSPRNETPEARAARFRERAQADARSREIDEKLLETKKILDKKKKAIKILLLGQAESGKTALLKNFQLAFNPTEFRKERAAWKYVIHLNIIRSVRKILEVLEVEWLDPDTVSTSPTSPTDLKRVALSLRPLLAIEEELNNIISANTGNQQTDVCVRAGGRWKRILSGVRSNGSSGSSSSLEQENVWVSHKLSQHDSTRVLVASKEDIITLWRSPMVADALEKHKVDIKADSGFFLDDVYRIASYDYIPSDTDVVKARLRTMGAEEHKVVMENGPKSGQEIYIRDVGGSTGMRQAWASYMDDVHVIIFLAPLVFHQVMEDNHKVNRLQDSLLLWKQLCQNKILQNTTLIIFFNKKDILKQVLSKGVQVKTYVPSYGDLPNEEDHVEKYFREKFRSHHKNLSPIKRQFIWRSSCAIDTKDTSALLVGVHESILRKHLEQSEII